MVLRTFLGLAGLICLGAVAFPRFDPTLSETPLDAPWAGLAREWIADCAGVPCDLENPMRQAMPKLWRAVAEDGRDAEMAGLWGHSVNFDQEAHAIIVDPSILDALARDFGEPSFSHLGLTATGNPVVHAGLAHTYGYLFSVLKTAYGYKRERWVAGDVERGLGLSAGTLGPTPVHGTLLGNLTYFAGRIALRASPEERQHLSELVQRVAPELVNYDYASLLPTRLEETVVVSGRTVRLWTDYVPFRAPSGGNTHWLIYTVCDPAPRLITAFPVSASSRAADIARVGGSLPITTNYNGYVDGLTDVTLPGSRAITP